MVSHPLLRASVLLPLALLASQPAAAADGSDDRGDAALSAATWDLYLSGYARHSRSTYTGKRLAKLNELAWGAGIGRTWRGENGNEASVYVMTIRDSSRNRQWMAGAAYEWIARLGQLNAGLGVTAAVVRRQGWFHDRPFPVVLPVASIGTEKARLVATYVPHLPRRKGQGNVLLLQLKFSF